MPNGAIEWQRTFGFPNRDVVWSAKQTIDGGYIAAGGTSPDGLLVLKLDASGNIDPSCREFVKSSSATIKSSNVISMTTFIVPQITNYSFQDTNIFPQNTNATKRLICSGSTSGNLPPIAEAGEDRSVFSGQITYFNGSNSYDPDGTIISYRWDFGDGEATEGKIVNHRYRGSANQIRTYLVTLRVTDDQGGTNVDKAFIAVAPLEKMIEVIHQPSSPIGSPPAYGKMTVTYNWINNSQYVISKIHYLNDGFLGISTISIWDFHSNLLPTLRWSRDIVSFEKMKDFYPNLEKVIYGGDTFEGISVEAFDAMNVIITGWAGMSFASDPYITLIKSSFFKVNSACFQPDDQTIPSVPAVTPKWDLLQLCSPGELRIYDAQGRVTGWINGEKREDIPNSTCDANIVIMLYPSDSNKYKIMGTNEGLYGLRGARSFQMENGTIKTAVFVAGKIPISIRDIHQYILNWDYLLEGKTGAHIQIDSNGDDVFELIFDVANTFSFVDATVDLDPNTLQIKSKGNWITAYIELPKEYDLNSINVSSINLKGNEDIITGIDLSAPKHVGDYDQDNIPDLMVKFDRAAVNQYLKNVNIKSGYLTLALIGQINDKVFGGTNIIKIIN
jgi:hypothetical protein